MVQKGLGIIDLSYSNLLEAIEMCVKSIYNIEWTLLLYNKD